MILFQGTKGEYRVKEDNRAYRLSCSVNQPSAYCEIPEAILIGSDNGYWQHQDAIFPKLAKIAQLLMNS